MSGAGYRQRLGGVHTWAGIVLGVLLFAIFWMGTLSVFDRELDRWMMPATRLAAPQAPPRLDALVPLAQAHVPEGARQWRIDWPTARTPVLRLSWQTREGAREQRHLDPATLAVLPDAGTWGASGFFFPFHYGLHIDWNGVGKWLVGIAGMGMLVLLVSGVVIHRKLLADFFTFRPRKRLPRSSLDLHNLTGVAALPFHFAITLSGLVIFWAIYFPQAHVGVYGTGAQARAAVQADGYGRYRPPRGQGDAGAGVAGTGGAAPAAAAPLASLDAMAAQARQVWGGGAEPYFVRVWKPGRADSYVEFRRSYAREVSMNLGQLYFDAGTGRLLQRFEAAPAMGVQRFLSGLHFVQFEHALLRWLYFGLGLCGCVMIATGQVYWLATRRARTPPHAGGRVVAALSVAGTAGLVVATLAYLAANRLLPAHASVNVAGLALDRGALEVAAFCAVWLGSLLHAGLLHTDLRGARAWRDQARAIAVLAPACVALNAWTTGAYGAATIAHTPAAVWGVDGLLLALGVVAAVAARRLQAAAAAGVPARKR